MLIAVTELEIQEGILHAENNDAHCLVYQRQFRDMSDGAVVHDTARRYMDSLRTDDV